MEQEYGKDRAKLIRQKHSKSKVGMYSGERNPRWKGGVKLDPKGYISIYKPNHPFNNQNYVQEHRLIMEKQTGRYLEPGEEIHHVNGIKNDNRIENLMLLKNKSEHRRLHRGELSSNWRGGLSSELYPKIFSASLKEKIRIKYDRICQLCRIRESKLKGYFKKLAIHHINYVKNDCRAENLIPLCHDCNSKTSNGDREQWSELLSRKVIKNN